MKNNFFYSPLVDESIRIRIRDLSKGKVGFYSIGLYAASLAYNCAMQTDGEGLLLAARPHRDLLGAFSEDVLDGMDPQHIETLYGMGTHIEGDKVVNNNLSDLLLRCEIVILSANSNHIEEDLYEACRLRTILKRECVVLACLSGSFSHNEVTNESYILCEKENNLAFFSGFHRHDALRNPLDSFTANFCHPNAVTALLGAKLLDGISPNIQVSPGVHNIEGQYIKAAKNISSIFAGFGHTYHSMNPGLLPTLLTLLLNQCLDQAASVSVCRDNRDDLYDLQPFPLTELGYGVQRIEAALLRNGFLEKVRDHTFSQLTAMVADVRGSMMMPNIGKPTRNFQAGQVLADRMKELKRCPYDFDEFIEWCEFAGLKKGGLEGIKSLKYWPQILRKYSIPLHDSSMNNLLYMSVFAPPEIKDTFFSVMTQSRELANYCQDSVRPSSSRRYADALNNIHIPEALELIVDCIYSEAESSCSLDDFATPLHEPKGNSENYKKALSFIEHYL
ncbi:hypothetical protein [Prochlorococcus sp. MIT 1307]|uniref:hypothetical protein n=1 Tax=Prochlorococcus sp. MIT 1307 TaxID=3096219 RepID=UPI002A757B26|nr:hypothetical protein [Prochlorococcus sp. MIT 1307]